MLNIGFRAHDFGTFSNSAELADVVNSVKKNACIQLALNKSFPQAKKWDEWDDEYITSFLSPLFERNVSIAVVGCYINPVCSDEEKKKKELLRFERSLSLTSAFNCKIVGTETGSPTVDNSYSLQASSQKNLVAFYKSLEQMLNAAIKYDSICAIEPVCKSHTICSVQRTVAMLEKFNDEHLRIIYDPINLLPWIGLTEKDGAQLEVPSDEAVKTFITEALDAFGDKIVAIHLKDFKLNDQGYKIGNLPSPTGSFKPSILFDQLRARKIEVPILLENLNPQTVRENLTTLSKL